MATHGRRSQGDGRLVAALLEGQTIAAAAATAGMSAQTAHRRLKEAPFQTALAQARAAALGLAITRLTAATVTASAGLERLAAGGVQESVQLAACRAILELALKGAELLDIETRLTALEARAAAAPAWTNGRVRHGV